jgi:hypothetical protein
VDQNGTLKRRVKGKRRSWTNGRKEQKAAAANPADAATFTYSNAQQTQESGANQRVSWKPEAVKEAEDALSKHNKRAIDLQEYQQYVAAW